MQVRVFVTPHKGILDPQGRAVEQSLHSLGFTRVRDVHIGRYVTLEIDAAEAAEARELVRRMCEEMLANPLIEDFTFEIEGE